MHNFVCERSHMVRQRPLQLVTQYSYVKQMTPRVQRISHIVTGCLRLGATYSFYIAFIGSMGLHFLFTSYNNNYHDNNCNIFV